MEGSIEKMREIKLNGRDKKGIKEKEILSQEHSLMK